MAFTTPFPYDVPVSPETHNRAGQTVRSPYFSQEIVDWLLGQQRRVEDSPERLASTTTLTAQAASITATSMSLPTLTTGYYRISYYTRITRAATTSSSLIVTIGWTDGTIALTQAGANLTGNTTATQQNGTLFLRVDNNAAITYATTYTSVGGTSMQYRLDIVVEKLPD